MDIGAASSTSDNGDAVSFDSELAANGNGNGNGTNGAAVNNDEWFCILTLPQSFQRTLYILTKHPIVLLRTTVLCLLPSLIAAIITALVHEHEHADPATYIRELPFTEILQDLPLVLWHLILLVAGCLAAQGYTVRYLAETVYAASNTASTSSGLQTLSNHSSGRRANNSKHGAKGQPWRPGTLTVCTAAAAGLWILLSLTAVALAGHFLALGLWDLRQNAARTHQKHPGEWILGLIVLTCTVMIFAVAAVALFGVAWLATCHITVVPLIVLQQASPITSLSTWSSTASLLDNMQTLASTTGTQMLEVFRQAYVLARGAHNFIDASLFCTIAPVVVGVLLLISLPLYEATHTLAVDFIAWLGGTPQGVVALYAPVLAVLPILGIQQTILYVTLRVNKEEYTREALQADLKQSNRANNSEYAPINVGEDDDNDVEEEDGFADEGGFAVPQDGLEMQDIQPSSTSKAGLPPAVTE